MDEDAGSVACVVPDDKHGERLDKTLGALIPDLSRSRLKRLILDGRVVGDRGPVDDPAGPVRAGQRFTVRLPAPEPIDALPEEIALDVAYEDDDIIVIDKPAGMVVHPAPGHPGATLVNALLAHCGPGLSGIGGARRPGIVHRIDKDTSGLLVAAKSDAAHRRLTEMFESHALDRRYQALVWGVPVPTEGTIEARIGRDKRNRKRMSIVRPPAGKPAVTHYRTTDVYRNGAVSLQTCSLQTGRTHQIRVHMASRGHAVIGDPVYGRVSATRRAALTGPARKAVLAFPRQALHAAHLGFAHPVTGESLTFDSPLPHDIKRLIDLLELP